jgi:hypothetical protein
MRNEVVGFELEEDTRTITCLRNGKSIGCYTDVNGKEIHLVINSDQLVAVDGWYRRDFVSFYRTLPKFFKAFKKLGFWVYGGIYIPNLEKATLNALYDRELALAGIPEPKPPKRIYKPRKPKGVTSGQEEPAGEVTLA